LDVAGAATTSYLKRKL